MEQTRKIVLYIIDRTMSVNYAVYATLSLYFTLLPMQWHKKEKLSYTDGQNTL